MKERKRVPFIMKHHVYDIEGITEPHGLTMTVKILLTVCSARSMTLVRMKCLVHQMPRIVICII